MHVTSQCEDRQHKDEIQHAVRVTVHL